MRIGEVARRSGVPRKTLRYYEDVGVLSEPARSPNGYRDYDAAVVDRLAFVRAAQAVGLTLGEIREIVEFRDAGRAPCAHVLDLIRTRGAELDDRIAELERMRDDLHRLERRARHLDPEDCPEGRVCHLIA